VEKFLPLHVAGDLKGRRAAKVANHLATCGRCRVMAEEYDASRNFVRAAATLPPDFDGAFYAELRRSVLDEISRTRPLAPPPSFRFASLFNARFAYAASLGLLVATVAALSLQSYLGRKSTDGAAGNLLADTKLERPVRPQATGDGRETSSPADEAARENGRRGAQQAAQSSSPRRHAVTDGNTRNETQRSVNLAKHAPPPQVRRNSRAPIVAAPGKHVEEIARSSSSGETSAAPEVSRIEIQTSDPNIRIIWLSPKPDDIAQPLK
jgi:hypothetical protein